nr:MAG TPA: hypothetical protein [Caudoviricetes sp.]
MEIKEAVIKSTLYPFAIHAIGCEEDIECFKHLIDDSSELRAFIADLEKCILDISEAVNGALEVVRAHESN